MIIFPMLTSGIHGRYNLRLTFKNSRGEEREIADVANKEQAIQEINKFCSDRKYTIYYVRNWEKDNIVHYDVGSWSEFFYLYLKEEDSE